MQKLCDNEEIMDTVVDALPIIAKTDLQVQSQSEAIYSQTEQLESGFGSGLGLVGGGLPFGIPGALLNFQADMKMQQATETGLQQPSRLHDDKNQLQRALLE